jgi:osmoprotectant transport system substrate-binding protein
MIRSRWRAPLALTLALALALTAAACGSDKKDSGATGTTTAALPSIRLAPQDFAEAKTLTEVYAQYLTAKGFNIDLQKPDGFRDGVYPDLKDAKIDMIIDYAGSGAAFLDKANVGSSDPAKTATAFSKALAATKLVALTAAPAEDANALVALSSFATANGLTNISDLAKVKGTIKIGGAEDCREREDCLKGYTDPAVYGLKMDLTPVEYGPPLIAALDAGTVQVAQYQTTFPELAGGKYVVLKDDKGILSSDHVTPVVRKAIADAYGAKLRQAVDALSAKITTADLIAWNVSTDINKDEPADVAKAWLTDKGLL